MECEPEEWEGIQLERYISHEKNPELKEALKDLNEFLPRDGILREGMYGSDSVVFLHTLLSGEFEGVSGEKPCGGKESEDIRVR